MNANYNKYTEKCSDELRSLSKTNTKAFWKKYTNFLTEKKKLKLIMITSLLTLHSPLNHGLLFPELPFFLRWFCPNVEEAAFKSTFPRSLTMPFTSGRNWWFSEDKARVNKYGHKLVELCKRCSLYIDNDRVYAR
jgi:hypothetical protein